MRLEFEHVIRLPLGRVYPYLADPRNRPRWQRSLREFEMISDGEPRVGMRWRERAVGAPPFEMEITAMEAGRLWAERGTSKAATGALTLRFQPEEDTTRLRITIDLDLLGWRKALLPFIRLLAPAEIRRDLRRAEECIGAPPRPG
jgi:uncharacterized protein YndB with AHSA1/START domain